MKTIFLCFSIIALVLTFLMLPTPSAEAATVSWSGALSDQTDIPNASLAGCAGGTRLQESYDLRPFYVDTAGTYILSITVAAGMPVDPSDTLIALYSPSFIGDWATNCVAVNDDALGVRSQLSLALTANTQYILVVTYAWVGSGNGIGATYSAQIDGPGEICLGNLGACSPVAPIAASTVCNLDNLDVTITSGDTPFNITGTGPGLPMNGVTAGTYPLAGPGSWTGVTVTEVGGDGQSINLGNFNCATNLLAATAICQADNLVVTITAGDTPFNITGTGAGLPQNGVTAGSYTLTGPGSWTGVTVTEVGGNGQSTNLGDFNCVTTGLQVVAQCIADNLWVTILNGDGPFNVTGTGPGLPISNIAASTFSLTGPSAWTGLTVTELGGNTQTFLAGNFACQGVGIPVPNRGLIKIDTGQAQFALQKPNGDPLTLTNGTPILLPADADHNGFDTYTVTGIVYTDGDYWLSIFLGNTTWGWVPLDLVTPLTPLELPDSSTSASGSK